MRLRIPKSGITPFQVPCSPVLYCTPGKVVTLTEEQARIFESKYPSVFKSCLLIEEHQKTNKFVEERSEEDEDQKSFDYGDLKVDAESWGVSDSL